MKTRKIDGKDFKLCDVLDLVEEAKEIKKMWKVAGYKIRMIKVKYDDNLRTYYQIYNIEETKNRSVIR